MKETALSLVFLITFPVAVLAADGYAMQDNYVVLLKDGQATVINQEVSLAAGIKITPDGVINRNGKYSKLVNGMMLDMSGSMIVRDGVLMKDGKMLVVKDGDIEPLTSEVVMSNGIRVLPDGSIITKMKEGDMMMLNGLMVSGKTAAKAKPGKS